MSIDATKPWWKSTTILAGIASILLAIGSFFFGWQTTPADAAEAGAQLEQFFAAFFGLLAIIGRFRADKRIG